MHISYVELVAPKKKKIDVDVFCLGLKRAKMVYWRSFMDLGYKFSSVYAGF